MTCDGLASRPGGVEIPLTASCYGNRDKLRQHKPVLASRLHFFKTWFYEECNTAPAEFNGSLCQSARQRGSSGEELQSNERAIQFSTSQASSSSIQNRLATLFPTVGSNRASRKGANRRPARSNQTIKSTKGHPLKTLVYKDNNNNNNNNNNKNIFMQDNHFSYKNCYQHGSCVK